MPFISIVNGTMTSAFALNSSGTPLGPGATAPLLNDVVNPYILNNPRLFDSSGPYGYSSYTDDSFGAKIDSNSTHVVAGIRDEDQNTGNWENSTGGGAIYDANTGALLYSILNPNPNTSQEDTNTFNSYGFNPNNINWTPKDQFGMYVTCTDNYAIFSSNESYGSGYNWLGEAGALYTYELSGGAQHRIIRSPYISQATPGRYIAGLMSLSSLSKETYQDTFTIAASPDAHPITGLTVGTGSNNRNYGGCIVLIDAVTDTVLNTFVAPLYMMETDQSSPWKNGLKRLSSSTPIYSGKFTKSAQNSDYVVALGPSETNGQAIVHVFDRLGSNYPIHEIIGTSVNSFGYAICINEDYLAISAPYAADNYGSDSGKVLIYEVGTWNLLYTIYNPNAEGITEEDRFGKRMSMSGRYLTIDSTDRYDDDSLIFTTGKDRTYIYDLTNGNIVYRVDDPSNSTTVHDTEFNDFKLFIGCPTADNNSRDRDGAIYAFDIPTTSDWPNSTLLHQFDNPNPLGTSEGDNYGGTVALSNNLAIVSAKHESDAGGLNSGKVYVYDVSDTTASSLKYTISNPNAYSASAGDQFGVSVAIDGDFAIIGAPFEDDANGSDSGKAYVFNVGSSGSSTAILTLDNPNPTGTSADDNFGSSVAINSDYVVVGSPYEGDVGGSQAGKVYVFDKNNGSLLFTFDNPSDQTANDLFGTAISINGNTLAISAPLDDDNAGTDSGRVYLYSMITGQILHTISNPNPIGTSTDDSFGSDIDLLNDFLLVGAPYEDDPSSSYADAGKAYVFSSISGELIYTLNNPNGDDTTEDDHFGHAVSLSDSYAIISGHDEDDSANSRTETGKAYFYSLADGLLKHTISNPISDSTAQSAKFSYSVAINSEYAVIGAPGDQFASFAGNVFVYSAEKVIAMANPLVTVLDNWETPEITAQIGNPYLLPQYSVDEGKSPYYQEDWVDSLAVSGDYIVSGMPLDDPTYTPGGAAVPFEIVQSGRLFVYSATTAELLYDIKPPVPLGTHSNSGSAGKLGKKDKVCATSNYIIAGYGSGSGVANDRNKVYFFDIATGDLVHTIQDPELSTDPDKQWPSSLDVSEDGNWLVVTCYNRTVGGVANAGRVYVYNVSTKQLVHTIDRPITSTGIFFGLGDAAGAKITNTHTFIKAPYHEDQGISNAGMIFMYENTTGNLVREISDPSGARTGGMIGYGGGKFEAHGGLYAISSYWYEIVNSQWVYYYQIYVYSLVTGNIVLTIDKPSNGSSGWGDKIKLNSDYLVTSDSLRIYIYNLQTGNLTSTVDRPPKPADHQWDTGYDWGKETLTLLGNTIVAGSNGYRWNGSSISGRMTIITGDMWENAVAGQPAFTSVSPASYGGGSDRSFTLTGNKFELDTTLELIDSNNISTVVTNVSAINTKTIIFSTPKAYTTAEGPLSIKITSSTGEFIVEANAISTGFNPVWTTVAGSLTAGAAGAEYWLTEEVSEVIAATDTEDPEVIYTIEVGSLPPGVTLDANTGAITGIISQSISSDTTYNFTAGVNDSGGNLITRDFSIPVKASILGNYDFTTFTFEGTSGYAGPTQSELLALPSYNSTTYTWLNDPIEFSVKTGTFSGMQLWRVPVTGTYSMKVIGAAGGASTNTASVNDGVIGGYGSYTEANVELIRNTHLLIIPGHTGASIVSAGGGGGGGSFVLYNTIDTTFNDTHIILAGGGGGGAAIGGTGASYINGGNGSLEFKGGNGAYGSVPGAGNIAPRTGYNDSANLGYSANYGGWSYGSGGGGGFLATWRGRSAGNGSGATFSGSGGAGFNDPYSSRLWGGQSAAAFGGFGGGGATSGPGAGGGGYSGGGGDYANQAYSANGTGDETAHGGGGGGLYYTSDTNIVTNIATGHHNALENGKVIITKL
jgi:hypothetical protein